MVLSDRHYDATKCATSIVGDCLANNRDRLGRREAAFGHGSAAPILLSLTLHRWRIRIFDFDPKR
jgi:hypothetical protein